MRRRSPRDGKRPAHFFTGTVVRSVGHTVSSLAVVPFAQPEAAVAPFAQPATAVAPFAQPAAVALFAQPAAAVALFAQPAADAVPFAQLKAAVASFAQPTEAVPFAQPAVAPFAQPEAAVALFAQPAADAVPFAQLEAAVASFAQPTEAVPFAQPAVAPFAQPAEAVPFARQEPAMAPFAHSDAAAPFAQSEAAAPFARPAVASRRPVFRLPEAAAGRLTPARIVPQVYRSAGSFFRVARVVFLLVAAPETMKSRQEVVFRRDFLRWVLPEDFASGSKSLSSQLKEAATAPGERRRWLPLLGPRPATGCATARAKCQVSVRRLSPVSIAASRPA